MVESEIVILSHYDPSVNVNSISNEQLNTKTKNARFSGFFDWIEVYRTGIFKFFVFYHQTFMNLVNNFPSDLINSRSYQYPILGIYEFVSNIRTYWKYVAPMIFLYSITTTIVGFYYLLLIFPITLGNLTMIFGVFGLIIAIIQAILEINAISLIIAKLLIFDEYMDLFFKNVLERHGQKEFLLEYKRQLLHQQILNQKNEAKRNNNPNIIKRWLKQITHFFLPFDLLLMKTIWEKKNDKEYWSTDAFTDIAYFVYTVFKIIILVILSNVPIIGPLLVMLISSPMRSKGYMHFYFKICQYDETCIRKLIHKHYGQFFGFGVVSSFIEAIPYLSLFGAMTNQAGAALWAIDLIEKQNQYLQKIQTSVVS
ncbi:hypothetical protein QEN19_000567 [Hanseniaspora menglaensis]